MIALLHRQQNPASSSKLLVVKVKLQKGGGCNSYQLSVQACWTIMSRSSSLSCTKKQQNKIIPSSFFYFILKTPPYAFSFKRIPWKKKNSLFLFSSETNIHFLWDLLRQNNTKQCVIGKWRESNDFKSWFLRSGAKSSSSSIPNQP